MFFIFTIHLVNAPFKKTFKTRHPFFVYYCVDSPTASATKKTAKMAVDTCYEVG